MVSQHYVYLYRARSGRPVYVGYGTNVERALSHPGESHNVRLREWLDSHQFDLTVAGPYRDEVEGKTVEAALISALKPDFNVAPGTGPKFVPVGVPPSLADRAAAEPLTLSALGRLTGGVLCVYLATGDYLSDGRPKYDPAAPDDSIVLANIEGVWEIGRHLEEWARDPVSAPKVLVGLHGPTKRRFIVGAARIDHSGWGRDGLFEAARNRWRVPIEGPHDLDAYQLRGRLVSDAKFQNMSWGLHIWVDGQGRTRHP